MKRFWTALAVAFAAIFVIAGCNDYGNTFQGNTGAQLSFLSPADVNAGGPDLVLKVTGAGFVAKTVVQWNGKKLVTTVTTDASGNVLSVTAVVPASLTAAPGQASVNTLNPFSGSGQNGLSNSVSFLINPPANPLPVVSGISPSSAPIGSADTAVTITGSAFIATSDPSGGSQVYWTAGTRQTLSASSISTTSIQATIPAALLATAGTATISVYNPPAQTPNCNPTLNCGGAGGGGTSTNAPTFTIGAGASVAKQGDAAEETPAVSADGRFVSYAAVEGENMQIFVRDTCQGANSDCQQKTAQVSVASDGTGANAESHAPSISSDGRYVAFSSSASNLATGALAGRQIYLRDTCAGAAADCKPSTQLLSTDEKGALGGLESILPSVSSSGRFVAFIAVTPAPAGKGTAAAKSGANGAGGVNSGLRQVFVRDTCLGATGCTPKTTRISLQPGDGSNTTGRQAGPALSGNADQVAVSAARTATLFTKSLAVDDRVFLAITKGQN